MRNTTESLGSVFDIQPTEISGNISMTDTGARQPGYFSVGSSTELRLSISAQDIPYVKRQLSYDDCSSVDYDTIPVNQAADISDVLRLLGEVRGGYTYAYRTCSDCLLFGGTNIKPDYW